MMRLMSRRLVSDILLRRLLTMAAVLLLLLGADFQDHRMLLKGAESP